MWHIVVFNLLLFVASGYALWRGGAPERMAGVALFVAALATYLLGRSFVAHLVVIDTGVLTVDLLLLAILVGIALFADRYWTMWMAALQALGSSAHLVRASGVEALKSVYVTQLAAWGYPIVILLIVATIRHRSRLRRDGSDLDWSIQGGRQQEPI